jgi:hypothetical protein
MTPPFGSVTIPEMLPFMLARAAAANRKRQNNATTSFDMRMETSIVLGNLTFTQ